MQYPRLHPLTPWLAIAVCSLSILWSSVRGAEPAFPARPIRMIVPFVAGSGTDVQARVIGQEITNQTGQAVVVENKPGASGMIAAEAAAKAVPDGYTIFCTTSTTQAANPSLYKRLRYNPAEDFEPIALLGRGPPVMVVSGDSPFRSLASVLAFARANPGKLAYASGNASSRVVAEMLMQQAHLRGNYIPSKSVLQAFNDQIAGQFDIIIPDIISALPLLRSGKLHALAVASPTRASALPNVPTFAEQGLPGVVLEAWVAIYAPAKTPPAVIRRLNELVVNGIRSKAFSDLARDTSLEAAPSTPEQLRIYETEERAKWAAVIKSAGIEPE